MRKVFLLKLFYTCENLGEYFRIVLGEVGEDLSVEHDFLLGEGAEELGVRHAFHAGSGIDLNIPELAGIALFVAAVCKGIGSGMEQCVLRLTFLGAAAVAKTFRLLQHASPSF